MSNNEKNIDKSTAPQPEASASDPENGAASAASEASASAESEKSAPPEAEDLSLWESLKVLFGASRAFWLVNFVSFGDGITYFGILTLLTLFLGTDLGMGDKMAGLAV